MYTPAQGAHEPVCIVDVLPGEVPAARRQIWSAKEKMPPLSSVSRIPAPPAGLWRGSAVPRLAWQPGAPNRPAGSAQPMHHPHSKPRNHVSSHRLQSSCESSTTRGKSANRSARVMCGQQQLARTELHVLSDRVVRIRGALTGPWRSNGPPAAPPERRRRPRHKCL